MPRPPDLPAGDSRDPLAFRALALRTASLDVDERSIEALVSTETPVLMPDWERMEMIPEVLMTNGCELPKGRQVPLLDSHQRWTTETQLGSARALEKTDHGIQSRLHFSSAADVAFTKVREGHVTDVSAGYQILKKKYIPEGETQTIGGREFSGPMNVVTKWRLREVSLTPIGADEQAKLRGLDPTALFQRNEESFAMNPELKALLVSRGMPDTLTDDEAQKWLVANHARAFGTPATAPAQPPAPKAEERNGGLVTVPIDPKLIAQVAADAAREALKAHHDAQRAFGAEVKSLCALADLPGEEEACRQLADVAAVRAHLEARKGKIAAEQVVSPAPHIKVTGEGYQRLLSDVGTAISMRACQVVSGNPETVDKIFPVAQRGKGWETFKHASIFECARECVAYAGIDVRGATREQIAIAAMFGAEKAGLRSASSAAYHVTGSFAKITQDAVNKSMMVGYTEAPSTWEGPMRRGDSVPDFKTIHRIRMGAVPNLPIWPDNSDPQKASLADAEETYAIESRSLEISFSYRLLVNDDMSALSRIPGQMGQAAKRTVNSVAWAVITANPTMSDSVALFAAATGDRKRTNLTSGAGSPSVSTVQTLSNLMMQMRGENTPEATESDDVLNLQPRYIVGPSALSTTIRQLVLSAYDPAANTFQVYNTAAELIPVIEPILDAASTTAWYLFASPQQIDTVEVSFLQGQESPVTRQFLDERNLAQNWTVLQTFAAKAMNHRGIQKHAGA